MSYKQLLHSVQFSSVQSLSCVRLFATPWITACQASLSITDSRSLLKLMSIESVMPSSHLILCRPLLLLPSIPPSIRVFTNESTLSSMHIQFICDLKVIQSCPILCNPIDSSLPVFSVHRILQARIAIPFSRESSQSRDRTQVSHIAHRFFTLWATYIHP